MAREAHFCAPLFRARPRCQLMLEGRAYELGAGPERYGRSARGSSPSSRSANRQQPKSGHCPGASGFHPRPVKRDHAVCSESISQRLIPDSGPAAGLFFERLFYFVTEVIARNRSAFSLTREGDEHSAGFLASARSRLSFQAERFLSDAPYMAGDGFTLVDIGAYTSAFAVRYDIDWRWIAVAQCLVHEDQRAARRRSWQGSVLARLLIQSGKVLRFRPKIACPAISVKKNLQLGAYASILTARSICS